MATKPTIAELQEQVTKLEGELQAATAAHRDAETRAEAHRLGKEAAERVAEEHRSTSLKLEASLRAFKGSATKARQEATVLRGQLSPKARPIGRLRAPRDEAEAQERREQLHALLADGVAQIVFSDGKSEVRELAPLIVTSDAFRHVVGAIVLQHEPLLEPGSFTKSELTVRGMGLCTDDGEQVAWCELQMPIEIQSAQKMLVPIGSIRFAA